MTVVLDQEYMTYCIEKCRKLIVHYNNAKKLKIMSNDL